MITFLHGRLVDALPTRVIVDVHGVGYEVLIPLSSYDQLPSVGSEIHLLTHLNIREDAHVLFGFMSASERELFRLLVQSVAGIGPKIALNILSGMSPVAFRGAVARGDTKALSQVNGVGRKTAERIVVELKDKVGDGAGWEADSALRALPVADQKLTDAIAALIALGIGRNEAAEAVRAAQVMLGSNATVEQLVRACLRKES